MMASERLKSWMQVPFRDLPWEIALTPFRERGLLYRLRNDPIARRHPDRACRPLRAALDEGPGGLARRRAALFRAGPVPLRRFLPAGRPAGAGKRAAAARHRRAA